MSKHVSSISPDLAVSFLQSLRPNGPWNLAALDPEGIHSAVGATFTDAAKARHWIAQHGHLNLHFEPNPAPHPTGKSGRVLKTDIENVAFTHLDIDEDTAGPLDGDPGRKAAVMKRLQASAEPPSAIIDSGGGVQALWRLTEPVSVAEGERINRALAMQFGADPGTHNADRLLRLPGTINYPNAKKAARGRAALPTSVLDSNDRIYEGWELPAADPVAPKAEVGVEFDAPVITDDLDALVERYNLDERLVTIVTEGRLSEPKEHDDSASAWLFDGVCQLLRYKVPHEVIIGLLVDDRYGISEHILRARHDPDSQEIYAQRQVRNALATVASEPDFEDDIEPDPVTKDARSVGGLSFVRADEVEAKPFRPLWPGRMFVGKLTTLAGVPDQGKSVVTCDITARVTRGAEWPDGRGKAPEGRVILLSAEDDPADTIKPRLMAAGAVLDRVLIVNSLVQERKDGHVRKRMLNIADDLAKLTKLVEHYADIRLLIIDPINAYMGTSKEHDSFRDNDVRAVLGPVKEWAEARQIAVLIVTHFKKGGTGRAIDQVMGSLAFTALSRSSWAFIEEKDGNGKSTGRKIMARIKQNISEPVPAIVYELVGVDLGGGISAPRVQWGEEVKGSADDLMGGNSQGRGSPKLDAAIVFIMSELENGPVPAADIWKRAYEDGISEKTLNRAKDIVGAISSQHVSGFEGVWVWSIPPKEQTDGREP